MKIVLKVLSVIFALAFLGQLIAGNFFIGGLILAVVCGYFGWKPDKEVKE
jgi:hypothetical protein